MKKQIITIAAALLFVAPAFANEQKSPTLTTENSQIVSVQLAEARGEKARADSSDTGRDSVIYEKGRSKLEQAHQPSREKTEEPVLVVHDF